MTCSFDSQSEKKSFFNVTFFCYVRVELLIGWQPGEMVQWSVGQWFIGSVNNCHPRAQTQPQIMFGASRSVASSYLIRLKRVENNLKKNSRASSAAEKETVRQFWACHKSSKYCGVLAKWEWFIRMRAAFLAPILIPWVMKEGESKKAALILVK